MIVRLHNIRTAIGAAALGPPRAQSVEQAHGEHCRQWKRFERNRTAVGRRPCLRARRDVIRRDGIIFVAQRRLEDQRFVFDAAATGEPRVLSDTALAALWLRGSLRILPDSTLPSSVSARQHDTIAALPQPERDEAVRRSKYMIVADRLVYPISNEAWRDLATRTQLDPSDSRANPSRLRAP